MAWNWTREEVILACDLLSRNEWRELPRSSPLYQELSEILRAAPIHPREGRPDTFRSASSVRYKVSNIATMHPDFDGTPTRGGQHDEPVLLAFLEDPAGMQRETDRIRQQLVAAGHLLPASTDVDGDIYEADEGQELFVRHLRRERSRPLRISKLAAVRAAGQPVSCEVCGFDFESTYGALGEGFVEVHHRLPLHASGPVTTRLADLALLCSNCHRMIHRARPWLLPEHLAEVVRSHRSD